MNTRRSEPVRFASSTGPQLAGVIDHPVGPVRGWGVFVHGFTLGKDSPAAARTCRQLAAKGIGMLRFDALGLGESEGDWGDGSFTVKVADTLRAVEVMAERASSPVLLAGHSWGGAAAIVAGRRHPAVGAVATVAAPSDPRHVQKHFAPLLDRVLAEGEASWTVGGRTLRLTRQFVDDVRRARVLDSVTALDRPLLVLHSPVDETVDIEHAGRIFGAAHHPRSFVSLEEADHLLTRPGRAQRAAKVISAWAGPYLAAAVARRELATA